MSSVKPASAVGATDSDFHPGFSSISSHLFMLKTPQGLQLVTFLLAIVTCANLMCSTENEAKRCHTACSLPAAEHCEEAGLYRAYHVCSFYYCETYMQRMVSHLSR